MPGSPISPEEFVKVAGVDKIISDLKADISKRHPEGFIISDVYDDNNNQYVDLVQEGGGVWGIALVGYTYVLEKMGIRFFSLAGTSAGAINTMMIAVTGNVEDEKAEKTLEHLLNLKLDSLVDGRKNRDAWNKFVDWIVQKLLMKKDSFQSLLTLTHWGFVLFLFLAVGSFLGNFIIRHTLSMWLGLTPLLLMMVFLVLFLVFRRRFKEFSKNGYGLNEGEVFRTWINDTIAKHSIYNTNGSNTRPIITLEDFSNHFNRQVPNLKVRTAGTLRSPSDTPPDGTKRMIAIITCDITSQRKIEFPRMWDLYWTDQKSVRPGDMVRASMSIPIFFETYDVDITDPDAKRPIWNKHLNWRSDIIPGCVNFVDGGTLSNFPLNVFYNPNYPIPRMPTLGVRLSGSKTEDNPGQTKTFFEYANSIFSTIRFYYDRDFTIKNRAFELGVKTVDLSGHSSLNFFMENAEKIRLFRKGAKAAAAFLLEFDWQKYKEERSKNISIENEMRSNPNNLL